MLFDEFDCCENLEHNDIKQIDENFLRSRYYFNHKSLLCVPYSAGYWMLLKQ